MPNVRLSDVAQHAGVSTKTVSNVVHGYVHVRESTRAKVQRAIDELGYRPNLRGRNLATGRTGMIALAFPDLRIPYFAELAHVLSRAAGSADTGCCWRSRATPRTSSAPCCPRRRRASSTVCCFSRPG